MGVKLARNIKPKVQNELWARSAGRCQFQGCNRILYKSPVTQETVNIAQKAHIYSFSEDGPRGRGPYNKNTKGLNDTANLMLVCHDCHVKIDKDEDGGRYNAELLQEWKLIHERRVVIVTGVNPSRKSHIVMYGANIGRENSPLERHAAQSALFPDWYPADENPIYLDMKWEGQDNDQQYWEVESGNLLRGFEQKVRSLMNEGAHFSVFGLAPMPLLIKLGTLFTDKTPVEVYQLHREPKQTWQWLDKTDDNSFKVIEPGSFDHPPVLIFSLSAKIAHDRITNVMGPNVSVWELTTDDPNNDFLKTRKQLSQFRSVVRKLLVRIASKHSNRTPLSMFPAMPVSVAIDLGRVRMPKAEMPWVIYDQNNKSGNFVKALSIGDNS